ncbi:MAG: oligosaccharide flippase family protein [Candidatus Micrarchaeia archaeon]|jgi:O-antigen/teichoic acid export membrane protein
MADGGAAKHSREVAWGSFWGLAGTVSLKLVSFLYVIYLARAFSQENVGLFYLALSVIGLIGFWRDFGLPAALQRYVPYYEAKKQGGKAISLFEISRAVSIILGVLLFALIFLLADPIAAIYQNSGLAEGLRMLAAYVLLENLYKVYSSYLQGRGDIPIYQGLGNLQNVAKLVFTFILFTFCGPTLFSLSMAFILALAAVVLASIHFARPRIADMPLSGGGITASELMREIIPFGFTLTIVQSLWALISSMDRVLLGYFGNPASSVELVAIYSLATQLALTIAVFPAAVGGIFLPVISRLAGKGDHSAMLSVIQTSQRWILFVTIPIAVATMAFAGEMLSAFYGGSYRPGANAMSIFILGLLVSTVAYPVSLALAGMRLVRLELYVAIACAFVNLALNILLIPLFGMEGAAAASAAAFIISALMFERYGRQRLSYSTPWGIYKLFIAGAVAFAAIFFLLKPLAAFLALGIPLMGEGDIALYAYKLSYLALLGLMGCIGLVIFGAVALLLRTFRQEDVDLMRSAARKARVPPQLISIAEKIALMGVEEERKG